MKFIELTQGYYATVDDKHFEKLNRFKWCVLKCPRINYAMRIVIRDGKRVVILMHRVVLRTKAPTIDHLDSDGINNIRSNLRAATHSHNGMHQRKQITPKSSRFKGVCWHSKMRQWSSYLSRTTNGIKERVWIGAFDDEVDAAKAYDTKAKKYFGEFALLNFPDQCR